MLEEEEGFAQVGNPGESANTCYEISLPCVDLDISVALNAEELQTLEHREEPHTTPFLLANCQSILLPFLL